MNGGGGWGGGGGGGGGGGVVFFFKQKTAYEIRNCDWSSDVCSSDLTGFLGSLKISLCEERRLEDTQNLKCEDRRFQNCLVLTTEDLATKPTKLED